MLEDLLHGQMLDTFSVARMLEDFLDGQILGIFSVARMLFIGA